MNNSLQTIVFIHIRSKFVLSYLFHFYLLTIIINDSGFIASHIYILLKLRCSGVRLQHSFWLVVIVKLKINAF